MSTHRVRALDRLRGVAALVVVLHHVAFTSPALADADAGNARRWSIAWWLAYTPLHAVWMGTEAVYVFFVLSGFVLLLPALSGRIDWRTYYAKRLVRLYLPVWGALLIGVVLIETWHRNAQTGMSLWLLSRTSTLTTGQVTHDAALVLGSATVSSVFWTLRYEVLFSALLPAYVAAISFARRRIGVSLGILLAMTAVAGYVDTVQPDALLRLLIYLPMFGVGALIAVTRADGWRTERPALLAASGVALLLNHWLLLGAGVDITGRPAAALDAVSVAVAVGGAALVMIAVLDWPVIDTARATPLDWLGSRSFSLYLVHEPIVVTVAFALGVTSGGALWVGLIAVPVSLLVADVFWRAVEQPSLRFARWLGRVVGRGSLDRQLIATPTRS